MTTYFFILGNNSALSVAEILNKFQPQEYSLVNKEVLRVEFAERIDEGKAIKELGGVIKIVEQLEIIKIQNTRIQETNKSKIKNQKSQKRKNQFLETIKKYLPETFNSPSQSSDNSMVLSSQVSAWRGGKYKFGFSFYGGRELGLKKIAMDIKRELKARKISCRWIIGKSENLSSVIVAKNRLIDRGQEFVVVFEDKRKYLGITKAVQDFEALSFRDYNRPARDSHSGMIPPKLAQIMLNIGLRGETNNVLLDPFCGSGTIVMEAMLLGVGKTIGMDVSEKAVQNAQKNSEWVREKFELDSNKSFEIKVGDATKLSNSIEKNFVSVIVTEPYLGPQEKVQNIEKVRKDLEILYTKVIAEFGKILKTEGRVVMIWPFFKGIKNGAINPEITGFKIVNQIPADLGLKQTQRGTVIYGRKGQRVWREIVTLECV